MEHTDSQHLGSNIRTQLVAKPQHLFLTATYALELEVRIIFLEILKT